MCYSIEEVLQKAITDHYTSSLDNEGCIAKILYGKIQRIRKDLIFR